MKYLVLISLALASTAFSATLLNGAGATFPYPLYSKWFAEYGKVDPDTKVNYQSIGSGGGIKQFSEKTVDFGATDAPMSDEQLGKLSGPALHIPTVLGAVVLTYHLPGVNQLTLSGDLVAQIFLGKIVKWNDPAIVKLNPGWKGTGDILVVHRADGSGTSNIFTDYLTKVSPDWATSVGRGTAVKWPAGLGGKGNEGVTQLVKQTPGAIGYVELLYAESNSLPFAALVNKAGKTVKPSLDSVTAAAAGMVKSIPNDFRVSITNAEGAQSYPISGFTYLLVSQQQSDALKGEKLVRMLRWCLKEGQTLAKTVGYSPLPTALLKRVQEAVNTIKIEKAKS